MLVVVKYLVSNKALGVHLRWVAYEMIRYKMTETILFTSVQIDFFVTITTENG